MIYLLIICLPIFLAFITWGIISIRTSNYYIRHPELMLENEEVYNKYKGTIDMYALLLATLEIPQDDNDRDRKAKQNLLFSKLYVDGRRPD